MHTLLWLYAMAQGDLIHPDLGRKAEIVLAAGLALAPAGFGLLLIGWSRGYASFSAPALLFVAVAIAVGRRLLRRA